MKFDLVIKNGRVIDPRHDIDGLLDIGFCEGKIAAIESSLMTESTKQVVDASGSLVVPGLIDLHAHVYVHGTPLGVDPDALVRSSGTTTLVDAGSAGAANFAGFRYHVIERSEPRILAFLNVSYPGIYGFGPGIMVGECLDQRLLHAEECLRIARAHEEWIVGIKVRIGVGTSGTLGSHPLDIALDVADKLQLPVMTHIGAPPPSINDVLERMRPGDILTHCFRPFPNAVVDGHNQPREAFLAARDRGVIFDIGHGSGSFGFETCRAMIEYGIPPDVISSDVHVLSAKGPAYDLLVTMSKFLNLGMSDTEIIRAVTETPAKAICRDELGHLGKDAVADAVILDIEQGNFEFEDCTGQTMTGQQRFALRGVVIGGKLLEALPG